MGYLFASGMCAIAFYFGVRFYLLRRGVKEIQKELDEIRRDVAQNQVLHLPFPDRELEVLTRTVNDVLNEIREERIRYVKKEKQFQDQMEAISHDLRTPLTVILGYLRLLKAKDTAGSKEEEEREVLEIIERKARMMEKLISQFYEYSRLAAGDYDLNKERVDIGKVLRETLVEYCVLLEKANLEVQTEFPDFPVFIKGEKAALERIFSNLFQNAGRYAQNLLRVKMQKNGSSVQLVFENDTDELSEADLPYLFERFYMKDPSRGQGGTGLGLTIAKYLTEEMQGSLDANIVTQKGNPRRLLRLTLSFEEERSF